MTDLDGTDGVIVGLFQFDGSVANIFAYGVVFNNLNEHGQSDIPSISFQALRKSSGSENATKPYFACLPQLLPFTTL
jgi:hypothetical protein